MHKYTDPYGDMRECGDEGILCDQCLIKEREYWASYFGIRPGHGPVEAMKPMTKQELEETLVEARKLK